eukprot:PLAT12464.14.p1 GENE.PLAT12464.14~~PLAT12464.14.p1  ORF type:complete len:321 (-),score=133.85 PLAT12464.14:53-925(-)
MHDRTDEFHSIARTLAASSSRPLSGRPADGGSSRSKLPAAVFSQQASGLAKEVHATFCKLGKLTKLVRKTSLFMDPTEEINRLTTSISMDIKRLSTAMTRLESMARGGGMSRQESSHSGLVVQNLQEKVAGAADGFKGVLEQRWEVLKKQDKRKSRFGTAPVASASLPSLEALAAMPDGGDDGSSADSSLESAAVTVYSVADSRAEAMEMVEKHVVELQSVFGRLGTIIHEHQSSIEYIDSKVEEAESYSSQGYDQLVTYWNTMNKNRMLMLKVFSILIVFSIFFVLFVK